MSAVLVLGAGLTVFAASSNTDTSAADSSNRSSANSTSEKTKPKDSVHVSATGIAASVLGKTEDEIKEAVKSGLSLYQQLTDAGKLDAFKTAYLAELKTKLDAAVTAGTLTQAETDEKYASKQAEIAAWDGSTELSKGGKDKGGEAKDSTNVNVIKVAASVLGKTEDEIKESVKSGKIGDLLVAAGKVDEFKTAYLAETKSKLDAAVTAGTLTQAEADEKYAAETTKMDAYDGTIHLCGGKDHSKMFEKKDKASIDSSDA